MKTLVILNHKVSEDQKVDLIQKGFAKTENDIVILPKELHAPFKNIDPSLNEIYDSMFNELKAIEEFIVDEDFDVVWSQGEFSFFFEVAEICRENEINLIISTTKREVQETKLPDGSVEKKMIFKHVCFRRLNF